MNKAHTKLLYDSPSMQVLYFSAIEVLADSKGGSSAGEYDDIDW